MGLKSKYLPNEIKRGAIKDQDRKTDANDVQISRPAGGRLKLSHNSLSGLPADDHIQYSRTDGARAFTEVVGGVWPTDYTHLTTREYVDDAIADAASGPHTHTAADITDFDAEVCKVTCVSSMLQMAHYQNTDTVMDSGGACEVTACEIRNHIDNVTEDHTQYLLLDGTRSMAAALNMGTHLINNVVNPVAAQDAATKNYVDTATAALTHDGFADTAASTAHTTLIANYEAYADQVEVDAKAYTDTEVGALTHDGYADTAASEAHTKYLLLAGGTMSGDIDMDDNEIQNVLKLHGTESGFLQQTAGNTWILQFGAGQGDGGLFSFLNSDGTSVGSINTDNPARMDISAEDGRYPKLISYDATSSGLGLVIDTNTEFTNSTDKLLSIRTNGNERWYLTEEGYEYSKAPGSLTRVGRYVPILRTNAHWANGSGTLSAGWAVNGLDLRSIVPVGTTAVTISIYIRENIDGLLLGIRTSATNDFNKLYCYLQDVDGNYRSNAASGTVALDSDRYLDVYSTIADASFWRYDITITGYFI